MRSESSLPDPCADLLLHIPPYQVIHKHGLCCACPKHFTVEPDSPNGIASNKIADTVGCDHLPNYHHAANSWNAGDGNTNDLLKDLSKFLPVTSGG